MAWYSENLFTSDLILPKDHPFNQIRISTKKKFNVTQNLYPVQQINIQYANQSRILKVNSPTEEIQAKLKEKLKLKYKTFHRITQAKYQQYIQEQSKREGSSSHAANALSQERKTLVLELKGTKMSKRKIFTSTAGSTKRNQSPPTQQQQQQQQQSYFMTRCQSIQSINDQQPKKSGTLPLMIRQIKKAKSPTNLDLREILKENENLLFEQNNRSIRNQNNLPLESQKAFKTEKPWQAPYQMTPLIRKITLRNTQTTMNNRFSKKKRSNEDISDWINQDNSYLNQQIASPTSSTQNQIPFFPQGTAPAFQFSLNDEPSQQQDDNNI